MSSDEPDNSPNPNPDIDRAMARELVEEFWRSLLLLGRQAGRTNPNISREGLTLLSQQRSRKFAANNRTLAEQMPPDRRDAFLAMIDEEDSICFEEHQTDPNSFYHRLGLNSAAGSIAPIRAGHQRSSLGELVVHTAVRATVWEFIRSFFRR